MGDEGRLLASSTPLLKLPGSALGSDDAMGEGGGVLSESLVLLVLVLVFELVTVFASRDASTSSSSTAAGGKTDDKTEGCRTVKVGACTVAVSISMRSTASVSLRSSGATSVYVGGDTYGGGGAGAARSSNGLISRVEFHIGSGATEKGRSRCKRREGPGTTVNPSPSCCCLGVVGRLSACSVAGVDGRSGNSVEVVSDEEEGEESVDWVGSSDGICASSATMRDAALEIAARVGVGDL